MKNFYFVTKNNEVFIGCGPDMDRARCDAKRKAGVAWDKSARLVKISNSI